MKKDVLELMDSVQLFGKNCFVYEINYQHYCTVVFQDALDKDELEQAIKLTWANFPYSTVEIEKIRFKKSKPQYLLTLKDIELEKISRSVAK
jgi:hypothetical protein